MLTLKGSLLVELPPDAPVMASGEVPAPPDVALAACPCPDWLSGGLTYLPITGSGTFLPHAWLVVPQPLEWEAC